MDVVGTPQPLRRIEEFVNTRRADGDEIATPKQLKQWLTSHDLTPRSVAVTEADRARAVSVREGLRALIADNNADPVPSPRADGLDPAARGDLAKLTEDLPLVLDIDSRPPRMVPRPDLTAVDAALATLLASVATAVADGTWARLKACREPSCRWAYFDHSRNRSRSWCSMDLCGNRAKARAFYSRTRSD
jgi:predicted RNA-binding Zn ribbon-like protein